MNFRPPERRDRNLDFLAQERGPTYDGNTSQLFTSMPSINEAAAYLSQTTSYFTRCITGNIDEELPGEASPREQELTTFCSDQASSSVSNDHSSSWKLPLDFGKSSDLEDTPSTSQVNESTENFPEDTNQRVNSASGQSGISIFQSLITRARKTVRGSADDIGWLQDAPGFPPVEDGTKRFMELLDRIRKNEHRLPDSVVYLFVPGLFSNHGPLYFVNTKTFFSKRGLACHIAKIHSEASVEKNAREIKDYIEEIYWGAKKRVLLFGHSKGGVDAAAALSLYWSELKDKVAGLVLAQSPYGGSPIASDILRQGQLGDYVNLRKIMEFLICKVLKGDLQALEDLTYERRKEFLAKHPLPPELPVVSFHTEAGMAPGVLATFSHVAHAELPVVPALADGQPAQLPVVIPLAATMAACAQLLQIRYGEKSDGLVTRRDAEVPGSVVVRPDRKLDHAWMVYSSRSDSAGEADASQVCEALLMLLEEISQKRRHEMSMKEE